MNLAFWKWRINPWLYKDRSLYIKYWSLVLYESILEFKVNIFFWLALYTLVPGVNYAKNNMKIDHACGIYDVTWKLMNVNESRYKWAFAFDAKMCVLMMCIFILFIPFIPSKVWNFGPCSWFWLVMHRYLWFRFSHTGSFFSLKSFFKNFILIYLFNILANLFDVHSRESIYFILQFFIFHSNYALIFIPFIKSYQSRF